MKVGESERVRERERERACSVRGSTQLMSAQRGSTACVSDSGNKEAERGNSQR